MAAPSVEQVADAMFEMVREHEGRRKLKPADLSKAMIERFGPECDTRLCKAAIRVLVDGGRCVYTYFGGTFIELPRQDVR